MKNTLSLLLPLILIALICGTLPYRQMGSSLVAIPPTPTPVPTIPFHSDAPSSTPTFSQTSADPSPSSPFAWGTVAHCGNANASYADNPFYGWSIAGASWGNITASYCDPLYQTHRGIDLGFGIGTEVRATADVTVVRIEWNHPSMGNNIKLCAANNWCEVYMHFDNFASIAVGDQVADQTVVGYVGNTGNSTGPHLHYEIWDPNGIPVNPAFTLP